MARNSTEVRQSFESGCLGFSILMIIIRKYDSAMNELEYDKKDMISTI
jgi:hypothetical protein